MCRIYSVCRLNLQKVLNVTFAVVGFGEQGVKCSVGFDMSEVLIHSAGGSFSSTPSRAASTPAGAANAASL